MKKFKVLLLTFLASCFLLSSAHAIPFYLDLNPTGQSTTDDGVTGLMSQISFVQDAEILQSATNGVISPGDTFTETGVGFTDGYSFIEVGNDNEGLDDTNNGGYEMTWTFNISGQATAFDANNNDVSFAFDPGGTVSIYVDDQIDRDPNVNSEIPRFTSDYSGYDNGYQIAELELLGGEGSLNTDSGDGDVFIDLRFINEPAYHDIWFDENGNDLIKNYATINWLVGFVDSTQKNAKVFDSDDLTEEVDPGFIDGLDEYTISTTGNAGMEVGVVPEPTTMLLFGTGLLGLGILGRRRFSKKN